MTSNQMIQIELKKSSFDRRKTVKTVRIFMGLVLRMRANLCLGQELSSFTLNANLQIPFSPLFLHVDNITNIIIRRMKYGT